MNTKISQEEVIIIDEGKQDKGRDTDSRNNESSLQKEHNLKIGN